MVGLSFSMCRRVRLKTQAVGYFEAVAENSIHQCASFVAMSLFNMPSDFC